MKINNINFYFKIAKCLAIILVISNFNVGMSKNMKKQDGINPTLLSKDVSMPSLKEGTHYNLGRCLSSRVLIYEASLAWDLYQLGKFKEEVYKVISNDKIYKVLINNTFNCNTKMSVLASVLEEFNKSFLIGLKYMTDHLGQFQVGTRKVNGTFEVVDGGLDFNFNQKVETLNPTKQCEPEPIAGTSNSPPTSSYAKPIPKRK